MSKSQRDKGKRGEREVANILRDAGYSDARRGVQYHGGPSSPDVVGLAGVHLEVKRTEKCEAYKFLEQAEDDSDEGEIPVVVHRQNGKEWIAILPFEDFLKLYGMASSVDSQAEKE